MNKLYKNWWMHNLVAHPLMQLVGVLHKGLAEKIHDGTLPLASKGNE